LLWRETAESFLQRYARQAPPFRAQKAEGAVFSEVRGVRKANACRSRGMAAFAAPARAVVSPSHPMTARVENTTVQTRTRCASRFCCFSFAAAHNNEYGAVSVCRPSTQNAPNRAANDPASSKRRYRSLN